jgi:hypothetical protein
MPTRPGLGRSLFVGLAVGAFVLAVGGAVQTLAWSTSWLRSRHLYGGLVALMAIVLLRPLLDAIARWAGGDRAVPAAWFGVAGAGVGLGIGLAVHLDHVFDSSYRFLRPYGSFWEMEPETFLAPIAAVIVAGVMYRRAVEGTHSARAPRIRAVAIATTLAAAVLVLLGSVRALHAPSLRNYFFSLALVGEAPPASVRGPFVPHDSPGNTRAFDERVGPLTLRRFRVEHDDRCVARLAHDPALLPDDFTPNDDTYVSCGSLVVRHDARHHLYLAENPFDEFGSGPAAFDDRSFTPIPEMRLSNRLVADGLSLPRSWLAVSWMLVVMAAYAAFRPSYAHRWLAHRGAWKTGSLGRDGLVRFDDGSASAPAPPTMHAEPGKVIVLDATHATPGTPFRDRGSQTPIERSDIVRGEVESFAESLRHDLFAHEARALAIALGVLSVLVAAASVRLVV